MGKTKKLTRFIPKVQLILDYQLVFGLQPPDDRISIVSNIPSLPLLIELIALNYRLKPKDKLSIDYSFERQKKELGYFTKTPELYEKYSRIAAHYTKDIKNYPIIFNRQACLFAIEEILNSKGTNDDDQFEWKIEDWESVIKYLLAVNYKITQIKKELDDSNVTFESLNPKLLPLNELLIETDQFFTPYRGYKLMQYFQANTVYGNEFEAYLDSMYGIKFDHLIYHFMSMYFANYTENPEHNFYYHIQDENEKPLFEILSKRIKSKEVYKLIGIRKSPFVKIDESKFLIVDNSMLIEKTYSQFLNDFWFDWLKEIKNIDGKPLYDFSHFKSTFGYFFENYLASILKRSFQNYRYSILLMFDELKVETKKGSIEIADVYLRYGNKILLGQAKSGNIYDLEKFGGDVESLYKKDRSQFFIDFGVNQLVESITNMNKFISSCDRGFLHGHRYEIYPCIIVNDRVFQTPLMANVFNIRFQELVKEIQIEKAFIRPLSLLHISDVEKMESYLNANPKVVWDIIKMNSKDKRFIPPFYVSVNNYYKIRDYPEKIIELLKSLITKFNPDGIE